MSKYVSIPNGNYKISVQPGGTIFLNTGFDTGTVEISGNLIVKGQTTTVNTATLDIEDNIITLNSGETGAGITLGEAGIKIERGSLPDAFFKYDEDVAGFIAINGASALLPLATNAIDSRSQTLVLNAGSNTVNVNPVVDYEKKIFTYAGSTITGYDAAKADTIPNTQAVVDYVAYNFANVFLRQIGDGFVTVSSIEIDDEENTGNPSVINFKIDAVTVAQAYDDRWDFSQIRITNTTIETINGVGTEDLVLRANNAGNVRIDDLLHINSASEIPAVFPTDGIKLYVGNQYTGKTGIFFANAEQNRDELVSKNRALLFGMLF
jgi:hypothetical protein